MSVLGARSAARSKLAFVTSKRASRAEGARCDSAVGSMNLLGIRTTTSADALDLRDVGALFVQQITGDFDRHLGVDGRRAFLHCFLLQDAQDMKGGAFGIPNDADHRCKRGQVT